MKELMQNVGFMLLGVLLLCYGCACLGQGGSGKAVVIVVLGAVLVLGCGWMVWGDARGLPAERTSLRRLGRPARRKLLLPYPVLVTRMQALAAVDDAAQVLPGYLSWSSQAFADIRIRQEGADNWVAVYWLRETQAFKAAELRDVCEVAAVDLPAEFCHARPHGLLIYQNGALAIYPAELQADLEAAFRGNILSPSAEAFEQWLAEQS